ncbi:hypothetical protein GCM10029963_51570 [Micromonospora andamanensis]
MTTLDTAIDGSSPAFQANRDALLERLAELDAALATARAGGGEKYVTRHHERGKLLPASASSCCWTRTARSSNCHLSPRSARIFRWEPAW